MVSVTNNRYECIVVGGGIAGSTAAYHLARLGYQTAVLEKTQGPHHKVCGEFLSFEALSYLHDMGIHIDDHSPVVKNFQLFAPHSSAAYTFPFPGRGISRYKLDEELLANARHADAAVFRGVCMRNYRQEDGGFMIETNTGHFYAKHLFMAIGKHDAKDHKRRGKDNAYIGFKTHLRLGSLSEKYQETTVLFTFPGGYGGICPVEGGLTNFCFVIDRSRYKSLNSSLQETLAFLRRSNHQLDLVLEDGRIMEGFCAVGYIPYGFLSLPLNEDNVYVIGDQRMVIPSLTGDGMAIALSTARECIEAFHLQKNPGGSTGSISQTLKKQMRWALMGHAVLKYPQVTDICGNIPGLSPLLIKTIFQKTRVEQFHDNHSRCGNSQPV